MKKALNFVVIYTISYLFFACDIRHNSSNKINLSSSEFETLKPKNNLQSSINKEIIGNKNDSALQNSKSNNDDNYLINAVAYVAPVNDINLKSLDQAINSNINAICFMPYAYTKSNSSNLTFESFWQWNGEKINGINSCIKAARNKKLKVIIKPHLWIGNGEFTGDFKLKSEADWVKFEEKYAEYILSYARICNEQNIEVLCLGTELFEFVTHRLDFWNKLIDTVRKTYSGKITYAANWDECFKFPLWHKLDYIGVDAYFPLSNSQTPSLNELLFAWQKHESDLATFANRNNKKILFTEFGYRSIDKCAEEPWHLKERSKSNYQAQANSFEAIFDTFWNKSYFAGGIIWKWYDELSQTDIPIDTDFTPQGKIALKIISEKYKFYNSIK